MDAGHPAVATLNVKGNRIDNGVIKYQHCYWSAEKGKDLVVVEKILQLYIQ